MAKLPNHDFWRYSLKIYSNLEVKEICLSLQNTYGANINILLFCAWYSITARGQIKKPVMQQLITTLTPWHTAITEALRQLRHTLSNFHEQDWALELRKEILAHELSAEHIEQLILVETYSGEVLKRSTYQKTMDCIANLHTYVTTAQLSINHQGYELLQKLMQRLFPSIPELEMRQLSMGL